MNLCLGPAVERDPETTIYANGVDDDASEGIDAGSHSSEDEAPLDKRQLRRLHRSIEEAAGCWQVTLEVLLREGCYGSVPSFLLAPEKLADSGDEADRTVAGWRDKAKALYSVGRSQNNDIVVDHTFKATSRKHCNFRVRQSRSNPGVEIVGLNPTHGLYVNGERVNRARIRVGDHILLGTLEAKVKVGELLEVDLLTSGESAEFIVRGVRLYDKKARRDEAVKKARDEMEKQSQRLEKLKKECSWEEAEQHLADMEKKLKSSLASLPAGLDKEDVEADLQWVEDQKQHVQAGKMGFERFVDKEGHIFYKNLQEPKDVLTQHDFAGVLSGTASTTSESKKKKQQRKQAEKAEKSKMLAAASGGTTAAGTVQVQGKAQGQRGTVFSDSSESGGFDAADAVLAQAGTANFAQAATAGATAWEGGFVSQEDLGAAAKPLDGAVIAAAATAGAAATTDDVATYMQRIGLEGWVGHFQQYLPEKCKSIADLRSTTPSDLFRLGKSANMKLDIKHARSVVSCLKKFEPKPQELGSSAASAAPSGRLPASSSGVAATGSGRTSSAGSRAPKTPSRPTEDLDLQGE